MLSASIALLQGVYSLLNQNPCLAFSSEYECHLRLVSNAYQLLLRGNSAPPAPWRSVLPLPSLPASQRIDPYHFFTKCGEYKFTESLCFTPSEFDELFIMIALSLGHLRAITNISDKGRLAIILFQLAHGTSFHIMESMFSIS